MSSFLFFLTSSEKKGRKKFVKSKVFTANNVKPCPFDEILFRHFFSSTTYEIDLQSRQDRGTQTAKDPLSCETEKLAFDIVYYNLGKRSASPSDDDIVKCLRNCVERILQNHSITFNGMMSRISLDRQTDLQQGFDEVANEIFREGEIFSWISKTGLL